MSLITIGADSRPFKVGRRHDLMVAALPEYLHQCFVPGQESLRIHSRQVGSWLRGDGKYMLDAIELPVMQMIYDRTFAFLKQMEFISNRHFTNGVFTTEGICLCAYAVKKEDSLRKAVDSLLAKGYIDKIVVKSGTATLASIYSINTIAIMTDLIKRYSNVLGNDPTRWIDYSAFAPNDTIY